MREITLKCKCSRPIWLHMPGLYPNFFWTSFMLTPSRRVEAFKQTSLMRRKVPDALSGGGQTEGVRTSEFVTRGPLHMMSALSADMVLIGCVIKTVILTRGGGLKSQTICRCHMLMAPNCMICSPKGTAERDSRQTGDVNSVHVL